MAKAAWDSLEQKPDGGIVITKYDHSHGPIGNLELREAGHPVPNENTFSATQRVLELTEGLEKEDTVLFLLSGDGSALFEKSLIPAKQLQDITQQLLASGADIAERNILRKHLSAGKGGRNQELALSADIDIQGLSRTAIFSVGSGGTDGPADAAGGFVTGATGTNVNDVAVVLINRRL